jgi:Ca2+-binding EF-hand superfamily protein
LLLSACASDDHRPPRGGERFGGPDRRPSLFVSPAGEPFRAPPGQPYPVSTWFHQADANGDGKLTQDEFVADAARFFERLDANHDGVIDGFELKAYETEIVPEITEERGGGQGPSGAGSSGNNGNGGGGGGRRRRRGGGGGDGSSGQGGGGPGPGGTTPQATGAAAYDLLLEREPVASADLNLNSRITLANFKTKAAQRFALLDKDGKGYLVLSELPKTAAQRQAERAAAKPPG